MFPFTVSESTAPTKGNAVSVRMGERCDSAGCRLVLSNPADGMVSGGTIRIGRI